jgi:hypothetical protein
MSAQNLSQTRWVKAQGTNFTTKLQVTTNAAVLHTIFGSHSGGSFRVGNGTLTSQTYPMGTYSPAAGPVYLDFKELEFTNGIFVEVGGAVNLTAVFNDLI